MSGTSDSHPIFTVPNYLTFLRLVLTLPFFVILGFSPESLSSGWYIVSLALFIIAGITDVLDGRIARKYGGATEIGRLLDPVVDKVLICGAFILLIRHADIAPWMVAVIVLREIVVNAIRGASESMGHTVPAVFGGKAKMLVESVTIIWILLIRAMPADYPAAGILLDILMWLTVVVASLSGLQHVIKVIPLLAAEPKNRSGE